VDELGTAPVEWCLKVTEDNRKTLLPLNPRRVHMWDRTSGRSPDLSLYAGNIRRVFSSEAFPRFRVVSQDWRGDESKGFHSGGTVREFHPLPYSPVASGKSDRHLKPKLIF